MARKTASRAAKRAEAEAAEALEQSGTKKAKKKKAAKRKTTRKSTKATERRRLVWGVFSGTLKEEARFPYDQKAEAEAKLEALRSRGKRLYFLQPIKEPLSAAAAAAEEEAARLKAEQEAAELAKKKAAEEESVLDEDPDIDLDPTAEVEEEEIDPPFAGEDDED